MSSSDDQTSKRLSDALDQMFPDTAGQGGIPDATPTEAHALPRIVSATEHTEPPPPSLAPPKRTRQAGSGRAAAPSAPTGSGGGATDSAPSAVQTGQGGSLRTAGRRPRVRRVTRVVRHIDPWSTFKVGLLFSLVLYVVLLTSGVLLWRVADSTGTLDNVERWFTQFGWETFELKGGEIFHNAWIIGLFGAVGTTGGVVLLATLFNLVSDIIGGVRVTVLEEEVVERTVTSTRRYVVRQGPAAGGAVPAQDWSIDDDPSTVRSAAVPSERPSASPSADWSID